MSDRFRIFVLMSCLAAPLALAGVLRAQETPEPVTADDRVGQALRDLEIEYDLDEDGDYHVTFDVGNGRSQLAIILSSTNTYRNMELREIWSFGYESEEDTFPSEVANALLEDTMPKILGGWAKLGRRAVYVVRLAADAPATVLMASLEAALVGADMMEMRLSGDRDQF